MNSLEKYFNSIPVGSMEDNVFDLIGRQWMLITAGTTGNFNTMTASWGSMGILWNKPVAICFIRPNRYTYEFAEKYDHYTLSFFDEKYRDLLNFCGTKSGRNTDKIKATGLTPLISRHLNIGFMESRMVIECRKLYCDDLKPGNFIIPDIARKNYPRDDYHRFYIGEVVNCFLKKN